VHLAPLNGSEFTENAEKMRLRLYFVRPLTERDVGGVPHMDQVSFWRKLYLGWMIIAGRFSHVQTLVILAFFYIFLIGPVAIVMAIFRSDPLGKRGLHSKETAWLSSESAEPSLERAKLTT